MSTGNEGYTPPIYTQAARRVMGSIDLDPASCAKANESVGASHFSTKEQNGLMLPWSVNGRPARASLSPPFGRTLQGRGSNLKHFVLKLDSEFHAGNIEQSILLVPANTVSRY